MGALLPMVALLLSASCGSREEQTPAAEAAPETPWGSVAEVSGYLQAIQPHVARIGQLQTRYEEALATGQQGSAERRGTGRNLASRAEEVLPGFVEVLQVLDGIEPPPLLATFHRDARKMLTTRIESLRQTAHGWEVEQQGGDFEPIYRAAEAEYQAANELISRLNAEVARMGKALETAGAG